MASDRERVAVGWSGGKDSALALHCIVESGRYEIAALVTTVTTEYERISIHGVRRSLLRRQASALGFDLVEVPIPPDCANEVYETRMLESLHKLAAQGVSGMVHGDIFLEDVRAYRERLLDRIPLESLFPLWGRNTTELARTFIGLGFKAVLVCVDASALGEAFAGLDFKTPLLESLPPGVDPCGENGEFHTFVWQGPLFSHPVHFQRGEIVYRDERTYYCDLLEA